MSRFRHEEFGIGISATEVALARHDGTAGAMICISHRRAAVTVTAETASVLRQDVSRLMESAGAESTRVRVTAACDLTKWWIVEPLAGMTRVRELRQLAALRFAEVFGEPAASWDLRSDWSARGPSLCSGLPMVLVHAFDKSADRALRCLDLVPAAERLRSRAMPMRVRRDEAWLFACLLEDRVTLSWHRGRQVMRVKSLRVPVDDPWPLVTEEVRRVGSADGESARPSRLIWAGGPGVPAPPADAEEAMPAVQLSWLPQVRPPPKSGAQLASVLGCGA